MKVSRSVWLVYKTQTPPVADMGNKVYNHVLKLNLTAKQWSLVDNYGDIPGVRMGESRLLVPLSTA